MQNSTQNEIVDDNINLWNTVPKNRRVSRFINSQSKSGFALTITTETRTLNVIESEAIRPPLPVRYCDVRN